jgi:nuclear cap-binding protein subunit 1
MMESGDATEDQHDKMVRRWGERWLRAVRRRSAIEEAFLLESSKAKPAAADEVAENGA